MQNTKRIYIIAIVVLTMLSTHSCKAQEKTIEKIPEAVTENQDEKKQEFDYPQKSDDVQDGKNSSASKSSSCDFSSYNVYEGRLVRDVEAIPRPYYAKKMRGLKGEVTIRVLVNKEGRVEKACIVSEIECWRNRR